MEDGRPSMVVSVVSVVVALVALLAYAIFTYGKIAFLGVYIYLFISLPASMVLT